LLHDLKISGFRCFHELRVPLLKRVNLFVGRNRAGKTTILEAAELLALGRPEGLWLSPRRRGELITLNHNRTEAEVDPQYLFYRDVVESGLWWDDGHSFSLESHDRSFECTVAPREDLIVPAAPGTPPIFFKLRVRSRVGSQPEKVWYVNLSSADGLLGPDRLSEEPPIVSFLGTDEPKLNELWDNALKKSQDHRVVEALKLLVPEIGSLVLVGGRFLVRTWGAAVPLGTFGDGVKRLLALSLKIVSAEGGIVLIDEIEAGLHHTVMVDMWKLVIETARRLNVQVLASTHSLDCVNALGWVQEQNRVLAAEVAVHRVEQDAVETVEYSIDEIATATRHQLEIR